MPTAKWLNGQCHALYYKNFNKRLIKTPKLYFYDTGLAAYLLRIENPEQLLTHPYRGPLFENLIINELIKNRLNQGRRPNLYFWRDRSGHEIDALLDEGISQQAIEIKAGQTITPDYFKGLNFWNDLTGGAGGLVFYAGSETQSRSSGLTVESWRNVARY